MQSVPARMLSVPAPVCKRGRILLVDDEAFNHAAFAGTFNRCFPDLQIDSAYNGKEAIELV